MSEKKEVISTATEETDEEKKMRERIASMSEEELQKFAAERMAKGMGKLATLYNEILDTEPADWKEAFEITRGSILKAIDILLGRFAEEKEAA